MLSAETISILVSIEQIKFNVMYTLIIMIITIFVNILISFLRINCNIYNNTNHLLLKKRTLIIGYFVDYTKLICNKCIFFTQIWFGK